MGKLILIVSDVTRSLASMRITFLVQISRFNAKDEIYEKRSCVI